MDVFPIEAESVDVCFMIAVLEHIANPMPMLQECYRILKSVVGMCINNANKNIKTYFRSFVIKLHLINEDEIREHVHYYSKKDILL